MDKPIVLVGLMGAGKTRVGTELSRLLKLPFIDADREIERAAGMPIPDIFEMYGEAGFRSGEQKVMLRLLDEGACVLASGGGAFVQDDIRAAVKEKATSIWLRADLDTLVERTSRTDHRPLLRDGDARAKLGALMDKRYPIYAEADIIIDSGARSPREMAKRIALELQKWNASVTKGE